MSPLAERAKVEHLGDDRWIVLEDLTYVHPEYGEITVPKRFQTDFASVPPFLPLAYTLTKNASREGAAIHDMLYREGKIGDRVLTREEADDIMYDVMVDEGVPWWKRRLIRFGLRIGGWRTWNRYRAAEPAPDFV